MEGERGVGRKLRYKLLQNGNSIEAKAIAMSYRFFLCVVRTLLLFLLLLLLQSGKNCEAEVAMEESVGKPREQLERGCSSGRGRYRWEY